MRYLPPILRGFESQGGSNTESNEAHFDGKNGVTRVNLRFRWDFVLPGAEEDNTNRACQGRDFQRWIENNNE